VRARVAFFPACLLAAAVSLAAQSADTALTAADADRFAEKLDRVLHGAQASGPRPQPITTTITDHETNAFLRFRGQTLLPAGVVDPAVNALGGGRLQGRATVDLDVVRQAKERGWLDPMRLLGGRLPVTAVGVLHMQGGSGRFDLESATVSGIPVPKAILQELVSYYTRGAARPDGVSLDAPFTLPAGIRDITVETGRAVIVQ